MRMRTYVLTAAVALGAIACADGAPTAITSPADATPDAAPTKAVQDGAIGIHVMRANGVTMAYAKPSGGGGTPSVTGIDYHGGQVLASGTKVVAVYWAAQPIYNGGPTPGTTGTGSADGSLVGFFMNHLGGSPYFNINHSYCAVACINGSTLPIANSVTYTSFWANSSGVPANGQTVSNSQILSMLESGFGSGAITYDPGTLYLVFTAGTVNPGGGFGTSYCAYHGSGTVTVARKRQTVLFAALPYGDAYPGFCTAGSNVMVDSVTVGWTPANGDPGADGEVTIVAHEIEETTTDMFGDAWRAPDGQENADKCAWGFGGRFRLTYYTATGGVANMNLGGKDFLVQMNWANWGTGGCAIAYPGNTYP